MLITLNLSTLKLAPPRTISEEITEIPKNENWCYHEEPRNTEKTVRKDILRKQEGNR